MKHGTYYCQLCGELAYMGTPHECLVYDASIALQREIRCKWCNDMVRTQDSHFCSGKAMSESIKPINTAPVYGTPPEGTFSRGIRIGDAEGVGVDEGPVRNGSGAMKFDSDKPRYDLIDSEAIDELAKVLTFGAKKYEAHNWRRGINITRLCAALLRHIFSFLRGESNDPETGLSHVAHAMCCCMFILWTMKHKPDMDDRYRVDKSAI